ncbi:uncharacterized protein LOC112467615 [Temnothorax curvispinosus]|uniref:Uncharacterized protein LOC112467615 n=1 Tax=Temnothorax curvispinosus TaxID=300111 RepID=A0A6J1RCS8_9HYME|nr:uncharacterized protein LOC112467615 [Temnothorax curvispinosus]
MDEVMLVSMDLNISPIIPSPPLNDSLNEASTRASSNKPSSVLSIQPSDEARLNNYVYHILMTYLEGEFQISCFDFQEDKENRSELLEKKGGLYFSTSVIAKLLIFHEIRRTQSWR